MRADQFFEVLELAPDVTERCFPAAPAWPGTVDFAAIADRQLRRLAAASALPSGDRLPDPGFVRFRADGEHHFYAPPIVKAVQTLSGAIEARTPGQQPHCRVSGKPEPLRRPRPGPPGAPLHERAHSAR